MSLLPLSFFLAAAFGVATHYTIDVPRSDWSFVDVAIPETNAVMNCEFEIAPENAQIRLVWIARKDLELFRSGARDRILSANVFEAGGKLRQLAPTAGDYALVLESLPGAGSAAKVKMKVWLQRAANPRYASPQRRLAVILISCLVFFGTVSFSAFRLRRQTPQQ